MGNEIGLERVTQIYQEITGIEVSLKENPREQTVQYICEKIAQTVALIQKVTALIQEVGMASGILEDMYGRLELELKERIEEALLSVEMRSLEGFSMQEKMAKARVEAEERKLKEVVEQNGGKAPAGYVSLSKRLVELKGVKEQYRSLRGVLEALVRSLKTADSGVRLQSMVISEEIRGLIGSKRSQQGFPKKGQLQPELLSAGGILADPQWEALEKKESKPESGEKKEEV